MVMWPGFTQSKEKALVVLNGMLLKSFINQEATLLPVSHLEKIGNQTTMGRTGFFYSSERFKNLLCLFKVFFCLIQAIL